MSHPLADELHVVTLALEDSVRREEWESVPPLLEQRDKLISALATETLDARDLEPALAADARCQEAVRQQFGGLVEQLYANLHRKRAANAYYLQDRAIPNAIEKQG